MSENSNFFQDLAGFQNFAEQALDDAFYHPLPDDWYIIVTDIVSSTQAVERGRYQDVNYVGAACIAALQNALPDHSIPTVFGGDGASAAVPASDLEIALKALIATRNWARFAFGLELRVGAVPMSEITARGESVELGKLDLGNGNELAMFRGSGIELADRLVKDDSADNPFRTTDDANQNASPDLSSLSCRWSPLDPENDVMLCVLIEVPGQDDQNESRRDVIYRDVLTRINKIVEIDSPAVSPVKSGNLKFRFSFDNLLKEIKTTGGSWFQRTLGVIGVNLIAAFSFRFGHTVGSFDPHRYQRQVLVNSDYKRINGTIQLVLDCTAEQSRDIESMLENQFNNHRINYGVHRSDTAIMTCITPDISNGAHLHYIDGNNGGFWHAANALKIRRAS